MFALFFSLYLSMFKGTWTLVTYDQLFTPNATANNRLIKGVNELGQFLTSIFGDNQLTTFGNDLINYDGSIIYIIAFALALITSIGIVVMAVKGVKKAFGIFFMGIR